MNKWIRDNNFFSRHVFANLFQSTCFILFTNVRFDLIGNRFKQHLCLKREDGKAKLSGSRLKETKCRPRQKHIICLQNELI